MPYDVNLRGENIRVNYYGETLGKPQIFSDLMHECGSEGLLFEDDYFPTHMMLLSKKELPAERVLWKRPHEISPQPVLIAGDRLKRSAIRQGRLGDCWLLTGFANLPDRPDLQAVIMPIDNPGFDQVDYCGIFHFRLFSEGAWVDVCVDDRLPILNGSLLYCHSDNKNEYWSALLEKACAKIYQSYDHLNGGRTAEAWLDLCGGITSSINMNSLNATEILHSKI